ncbi:MAG: Lrp/AsnC ligand binding domain-containing protein [Candidatus Helarchaeota archaeon]|nr:Lrp/AsnC ligand binding domain-containing protein [Candidatus Helarchaeota archaeon]
MPVAFVLVKAESEAISNLVNDVLYIDEVTEAYSIAGPWDIIIKVVSEKFENVANVVTEKILKFKGVKDTLTLMAFRSGVIKSRRTTACEDASVLEQENKIQELYRLCRTCYNLKNCEFGSRVIVFGP